MFTLTTYIVPFEDKAIARKGTSKEHLHAVNAFVHCVGGMWTSLDYDTTFCTIRTQS